MSDEYPVRCTTCRKVMGYSKRLDGLARTCPGCQT